MRVNYRSLLSQMHSELTAKKDFKWDIYNVGCGKV